MKLVHIRSVLSAARVWASPQADRLEQYREQVTTWLREEHLQLTRVQELLGHPWPALSPNTQRRPSVDTSKAALVERLGELLQAISTVDLSMRFDA